MVRLLGQDEICEALDLSWQVFSEFEAPDYSPDGVKAFRSFLECEAAIKSLTFYGEFIEEDLAGVVATRGDSHISMLFVKKQYHKRGIGRTLLKHVLDNSPADRITVHSSPYAVGFYRKLGFTETDVEQVRDGIRFIPMLFKR